jgi:hypothetical protein
VLLLLNCAWTVVVGGLITTALRDMGVPEQMEESDAEATMGIFCSTTVNGAELIGQAEPEFVVTV